MERKPEIEITARQMRLLDLVADGLSDHVIARRMNVSLGTVTREMLILRTRMDAVNRTHMVRRGYELGLLVVGEVKP